MSYILDALKKAEQARSAGKAPDLFTLQASDSPPRARPLWPWFLAGVLILNAAALFFWSQIRAPASPLATPSPAPIPGPIAAAPASAPRAITPQSAAAAAGEASVDEGVATRSLPPVSVPQRQSRAAEKSVATPPGKAEVVATQAAPAPKPETPPPVAASTVASTINQAPSLQTPPPAATAKAAKPELGQEQRVMALSELPPAVQQELPKMAISMHMYSGKPANRMASINDKTLHEGDELSPGLKLMEITADGMIFSYKGYRFKRGIN